MAVRRKSMRLTYEIVSSPESFQKKGSAVAAVMTEKHGQWFYEPHSAHASPSDAEAVAVSRAKMHAEQCGYTARALPKEVTHAPV